VPVFWQKLSTLVGAPFVAAMLGLFVLYEGSLLLKGELPQNTLSPLIIGCGFVGFLCTLIFQSIELTPQKGESLLYSANRNLWLTRPTIRIARAFPFLLALLLPMAIWAVCVRINAYGFTPFRIMRVWTLVFLGVTSCLGGYRWVRNKHPLSWEFPLLLAIFAILFTVGPFNAKKISIDSQTKRLKEEFSTLNIRPFVHKDVPENLVTVDWDKYNEILENLTLVLELGGAEQISALLDGDVEKCLEPNYARECLRHMGLASGSYNGRAYGGIEGAHIEPKWTTSELNAGGPVSTSFGTLVVFEFSVYSDGWSVGEFEINDDFTLRVDADNLSLIRERQTIGTLSLTSAGVCDALELPTHALLFEMSDTQNHQVEVVLSHVVRRTYLETQECSFEKLKGHLLTTER
jgi:hypothetical protein